ncbi:MAG: BrnA antitoxin family protein [Acetobacteraceae bacterium]
MTNETAIVTHSVSELRRRAARGSDLRRVRAMSEAALEAAIAADPDWAAIPSDWHARAEALMPTRKQLVSVRLDADILAWFRARGPGYQTRINAVLRAFVNSAEAK